MEDTATPSRPSNPQWLVGGGEMAKVILAKDWSGSPLGPMESWPSSLRTSVSLVLNSNFPIALAWGPEHVQIYNDGYWPLCGDKHPKAMGQDFSECWASAFPVIGDAFRSALAGTTAYLRDQRMFLDRLGFLEETFFTFSFSPIRDETGAVAGLFHPVNETTSRILSERRTRTLRDIAAMDVKALTIEQALERVAQILAGAAFDVPFALFYRVDDAGSVATLAGQVGLPPQSPAGPERVDLAQGDGHWRLSEVVASLGTVQMDDLPLRWPGLEAGPYPEPVQTALVYPLRLAGQAKVCGLMVAGVSSRLPFNHAYRSFFDMLVGAVEAMIANATAFEEERRRTEALAELDRAKTAFFSNVSHEFRTPLTLLLGTLEEEMAAQGEDLPPLSQVRLQTAHRNSLRLLKLVNTLLDFARIESGRVQPELRQVDLASLTAGLAGNFRSACDFAGLRLEVDCPPLSRPVTVDPDMWEKIVLNLLSNAFKFTLAGSIRVALRDAGDCVELAVRDTGAGIPAGEQERVFERFHRVKNSPGRSHEGTGIGLALTRELVLLHGGRVDLESTLGQGSEFRVQLPWAAADGDPAEHGPAWAKPAGSTRNPFVEEALQWLPDPDLDRMAIPDSEAAGLDCPRIVLADDNADMRRHIQRSLGADYRIEAVANGAQALAVIRREIPTLVLSDLMMPVLDGYGLLQELRADPRLRTLPVILLSARAGAEERIRGMAAGADDYLAKPFTARDLRARVRALADLTQLRQRAEQAQRDEALRASEQQFRNLAEAMPQIVWATRADGWNVYFNQQWVDYTGMTLEESYGHGWNIPFHPEDRQRAWDAWQDAIHNRGGYSLECRLRRADGEYRWWLIRGVPQTDEAGEIVQWFGTCTDIDDMKRQERERLQLESRIMQAQKMDSLGSLAGGVAHDMNNVLGAIVALVAAHQMRTQADPALARDLETILQACLRGGNLVKGLLSFARNDLVEERYVDLNAVVLQEVALLERTTLQRVQLETDLDPQLPEVKGDPGALHHSLMNLCVNAVDAMPEGGRLLLSTRRESEGWVVLEVADTGMGMPPEVLDKAMDPFFTTKALGKGTGLGLSIVYGMVKTHRGRIEILSEPGAGTRVVLRFPAALPRTEPLALAESPDTRPEGDGLRILLVDDDELILKSIPCLLEVLGHAVHIASSGEEAVAQLAAGYRPEVVLLDMNMPGMDGPMTLERLRALCPSVPVLLATGRADQFALDLVAAHEHVALLAKPFGVEDIQSGLAWAATEQGRNGAAENPHSGAGPGG